MTKAKKYCSFYLNDGTRTKNRKQFRVRNLEEAVKCALYFKAPSFWYGERNNDAQYITQEERRKNFNLW